MEGNFESTNQTRIHVQNDSGEPTETLRTMEPPMSSFNPMNSMAQVLNSFPAQNPNSFGNANITQQNQLGLMAQQALMMSLMQRTPSVAPQNPPYNPNQLPQQFPGGLGMMAQQQLPFWQANLPQWAQAMSQMTPTMNPNMFGSQQQLLSKRGSDDHQEHSQPINPTQSSGFMPLSQVPKGIESSFGRPFSFGGAQGPPEGLNSPVLKQEINLEAILNQQASELGQQKPKPSLHMMYQAIQGYAKSIISFKTQEMVNLQL